MIRYKKNIMEELKERGYSSTRIRREKILSESTMQRLRRGEPIGLDAVNSICIILRCQPGDILEVVPSDQEKIKFF
nr:MAG TPA: Cro/C1-type HTH DNA-binding domain protein [Caudoviricetes sp.]